MALVNRLITLIQAALAQTAAAFPQAPLPQEVNQAITDDLIFSSDDWNRQKKKIKDSGGIPILNGFLALVASRPELVVTPRVLTYLKSNKHVAGLDVPTLEKLEKREVIMKELVGVMREKIRDGVFDAKDWNDVKGELGSKKNEGGLAALNFFFWVLSQVGDVEVEKPVHDLLGQFAAKGLISQNVVSALSVHEAPPPVAKPTLKNVSVRHRTKFDNQAVVIRIGECTKDIARATIHIGTATVTIKNLSKGKKQDFTIYKQGQAKSYIVGEWKGKMTMTVEDTGEVFEIEPEITIKGKSAPERMVDFTEGETLQPNEPETTGPKIEPKPPLSEEKIPPPSLDTLRERFGIEPQEESLAGNPGKVVTKNLSDPKVKQSIKAAFERALKRDPSLQKVIATLQVGTDGVVKKVQFNPDIRYFEQLQTTLTKILATWRFPAARSSYNVEVPFVFQEGQ